MSQRVDQGFVRHTEGYRGPRVFGEIVNSESLSGLARQQAFIYEIKLSQTQKTGSIFQSRGILWETSGPYSYAVLLIHGADGDIHAYKVQPLAEHLTAQHGVPVLRFDILPRGDIPSRAQQAFAALEFLITKVSATTSIPVERSLGSHVVAQTMASDKILAVLAYPMIGNDAADEVGITHRRQMVLGIKPDAKVVFVVGSADILTSVTDLDQARKHGKAKTWLATIIDYGRKPCSIRTSTSQSTLNSNVRQVLQQHYLIKKKFLTNYMGISRNSLSSGIMLLDAGVLTGTWLAEMEQEFPASKFYGRTTIVDCDALTKIPLGNNTFDYETELPQACRELTRILMPAGYIDIIETTPLVPRG
ncbi:hypothetical protein BJ742DRAFT_774682 [Cladochytrium replicatum]|nr:hypothetical protein BJ742DRAFT_774682 [Cladochytrium replicatum]